ncbi:peptide/nickel transport system ATP-binding protein [Lentzea albidocapillata subsp. violacea]|uniref:Peptide/nickel transport system ATP-binding protein n=1 Tax=Lentzea albidocapillata subsp. violacea TaxID=128104 RepID=A0A1G8ZT71_9PSEU|nr:ATP-binding cassette domain-containing protein [Lentzea albidocapillata]SDK17804.1 peptide/nickel transport system ATP-binding protein [Lentzea albidocapillata subsp. violacea]
MLTVTGLCKSYRLSRKQELVAAEHITFTVPHGGALAIVGESGSGKTTVARMLAGLLTPDSGTIEVAGSGAGRLDRARAIQMVFQDPYGSLDPRLTARQCLRVALRLHHHPESQVADLLDQVGLGVREAGARPHELSGGQRQRLAIARALAVEPRVLVLDEAVAALDVSIQAQILRLLDDIRRETGVALVFISHDLAVVAHSCDDTLVMRNGRVVEKGPTSQVLTDPSDPYTRLLLDSVPRPGWRPAPA